MTVTLGLCSMSPVKSRRPVSSRNAVSIAGLPSATVTWLEPDFSATAVEMPPPNCTTKVSGVLLQHVG